MTNDFDLSIDSYNRTLQLTDTSIYDVSPQTREEFGIAVFVYERNYDMDYVNNTSMTDLSNPGETDSPGEWEITVPNTSTNYRVDMYWAPLWTNITYAINVPIVFYEDVFYKRTANGDGTQEPGTGNEWSALTTTDIASFIADTSLVVVQWDIDTIETPAYMSFFQECNGKHVLIDNSSNTYPKRYKVDDILGNTVIDYTTFTTEQSIIELPSDNIYILTVEEDVDEDEEYQVVAQLPIIEYCHMKSCVTALLDSILCNEFDPCCENCDNEMITKKEKQRFMLNQIIALYGTFLMYIHEDSIMYLGLIGIDEDRSSSLNNIAQLQTKIQAILERCDLCQGAWQTTTTTTRNTSGGYKPCNC